MLSVENVSSYYGSVNALSNISLDINDHEIIAVIGSNGAGKSTLMKSIMGIVRPKTGHIIFNGIELTKLKASKVVYNGISYVPEGRAIFPEMTVLDNLEMGAFSKKYNADEFQEHIESIFSLFPRLKERSKQLAGSLSGGEQQMLAMGRALMSHPQIILMDEPSMGLSPIFVNEIFDIIEEVSKSGTTVLLVEQNAKKALSIADRAYVLETGNIVLEGKASELLDNDSIKKAYLGE